MFQRTHVFFLVNSLLGCSSHLEYVPLTQEVSRLRPRSHQGVDLTRIVVGEDDLGRGLRETDRD